MAWNGNNDNWKWQLRDSKGRWIEMGRGVKWYSPKLGREVSGTVVGQKGREAIVSLTSEPNDPNTGKPQQVSVKGSDIEVIQSKATLGAPADKGSEAPEPPSKPSEPKAEIKTPAVASEAVRAEPTPSDAPALANIYVGGDNAARRLRESIAEQGGEDAAGVRLTGKAMTPVDILDFDKAEATIKGVQEKVDATLGDSKTKGNKVALNSVARELRSGMTRLRDARAKQESSSSPKASVPESGPSHDATMSLEDLKAIRMDKNLNEDYVKELTDKLITDGVGDNIIMVEGPADDQFVGDGNHLIEAADRAGFKELPVRIYANTPEGRAAANKAMAESEDAKASGVSRVSGAPEAEAPAPAKTATPAQAVEDTDPLAAAGVERTEPYALPDEKFPPTRQQQDIIDAVLAGKDTAVQALAGTGKTTTLEALAKRIAEKFPDKKIAYIAFNKSVQLEAEGRMPGNVESKTQHGLAYGWADKWMKDRSNDRASLRRADDVAGFLGIRETIRPKDGGEPMSVKEQAMAAMRTVDTFANSAEDLPNASHMPEKIKAMGPEVEAAVVASANKIWADLNKPDGKMRYSLDHMRKQWALTKPDLSKTGSGLKRKADIIFMDEAQDTPKVMAHLMDQQTAQKVVVGDSNQNIYSSFTGSIDYMSQVKKDVELPLTKSWRFGPEVADIGNRFLELAEAKTRVEGSGAASKVVQGMEEPDAILVRSNAGMLGEILGELEKGRKVGVPAGTKKDLQSLVASAAFLKGQGDAPPKMHDDLAAYRSWDEVVAEADAGNPTMLKIANMVNQHGIGGLRSILNEIVEKGGNGLEGFVLRKTSDPNVGHADGVTFGNNNNDYLKQAGFKFGVIPGAEPMKSGKNKGQPRKGWIATGTREEQDALFQKARDLSSGEAVDVTISTAHKSKGLEWDKVKIGEDFRGPKMNEETGELTMPSQEELRVAYVAVTRAKKELDAGSLGYVFDHTQENGGIPKPAASDEQDSAQQDEQPIPSAPDDPEAPSDAPEEDAPDARPEDDASREEAERVNQENEEPAPAPVEEAPEEEAPVGDAEGGEAPEESTEPAPSSDPDLEESPEGEAPVAEEEPIAGEDQEPEPEPEDVVDSETPLPDPAPLPTGDDSAAPAGDAESPAPAEEEEATPETAPEPEAAPAPVSEEAPAPAPTPAPAGDTAPVPEPETAPAGGTELPTPDSRPIHPVKLKAANYPDGTIIRSARSGSAIEKTNGQWHLQGYPDTPLDPMDVENPFVYDMPKQEDGTFAAFEGSETLVPGDIIITRKGTQAAVVGMRDGKIVVAPHNQTDEQRRLRPALVAIDPNTVKGVNKFESPKAETTPSGAPSVGGTTRAGTPRQRAVRGSEIKDVSGNTVKVGDIVRTDKGTGKVVNVRPSDGPSGSAMVEFEDGTLKSFRANKMRNTAHAEVAGGDDPAQMEIGTMGEAGDGRAFMVGKGNKPIFKGDNVALADGTTGKISGFAKGVQSVNIRVEGRPTDLRKKASVVDAVDYNAPDATTSEGDTTPETAPESAPEATPEATAPAPVVESTPEPEAPKVARRLDNLNDMENPSLKSDRALAPVGLSAEEAAAYNGIAQDAFANFDLENSTLNVLSERGLRTGTNFVIQNNNGDSFRVGTKVYDKSGKFTGVVQGIERSRTDLSKRVLTVRDGTIQTGNDTRYLDPEKLTTKKISDFKKQPDITFPDGASIVSINAKMNEAYPEIVFNYGSITASDAKRYAETTSRVLNKFPQLRATLVAVDTRAIGGIKEAVAYAATSNRRGVRDTAVVFNRAYSGDNLNKVMRKGSQIGYFNNVPEGKEMEYVMTHEFGHSLDFATGNITNEEAYALMKKVVDEKHLNDPASLGKILKEGGQISKYSTVGNEVYSPELVAESFADVEINGLDAKPISKIIHAELMKRLGEV